MVVDMKPVNGDQVYAIAATFLTDSYRLQALRLLEPKMKKPLTEKSIERILGQMLSDSYKVDAAKILS